MLGSGDSPKTSISVNSNALVARCACITFIAYRAERLRDGTEGKLYLCAS